MKSYYLSKHCFVCEIGGQAVFLDLKKDRYFSLPSDMTSLLPQLLSGAPGEPGISMPDSASSLHPATSDLAALLEAEGLVVSSRQRGRLAWKVEFDRAEDSVGVLPEGWPHLSPTHFKCLLYAFIRANTMLRVFSLNRIVSRVQRRRLEKWHSTSQTSREDVQLLANIYRLLQPICFSRVDACLKDSLVLIEFLASFGVYPSWIFGIKTMPFAAHCWVQHDRIVLNDSVEHVGNFVPLMVV